MQTSSSLASCSLFAAALLGLGGCDPRPPTGAPLRIILVSMDTVRATAVSGYGGEGHTPVLAEIASEGVLFRNVHALVNYTKPSHLSMFTGLDPVEHGVPMSRRTLPDEIPTLPEILRNAGYRTFGFHEGAYMNPKNGFGRGFEAYRKIRRNEVFNESFPEVEEVVRRTGAPYFLFLHTYASHRPYGGYARYRAEHPERGLFSEDELAKLLESHPKNRPKSESKRAAIPPETRLACIYYNQLADSVGAQLDCGASLPDDYPESPHFEADLATMRRSYAERTAQTDAGLGRLRELLRQRGEWDDTVLVVTSDHGEAFFEHGLSQHFYVPFEEVLRVPLIISYPRKFRDAPVKVVEGPVSHLDLLPTLLDLVGLDPPANLPGRSLVPVVMGEESLPEDRFLSALVMRPNFRALRPPLRVAYRGGVKLIEGHPSFGDAEVLLFDLRSDPAEERDLSSTRPDVVNAMAGELERYRANLTPPPDGDGAWPRDGAPQEAGVGEHDDLDEEEVEQLRALGYLE